MNSAELERCINSHRQDAAFNGFLKGLATGIVLAGAVELLLRYFKIT